MSELRQVADAVAVGTVGGKLKKFCEEAHAILAASPGSEGARRVKPLLEALVAAPDFVAEHCGPDAKPGLHLLYEDLDLGFQVLAHVNDKGRVSPPHNHGASWAIYAQAVGYTDMTEWACTPDPANPPRYEVKPATKYRVNPGEAGIYADGAVHSIDYQGGSRFVRVTGTNLDKIERTFFNPATGESRVVTP